MKFLLPFCLLFVAATVLVTCKEDFGLFNALLYF